MRVVQAVQQQGSTSSACQRLTPRRGITWMGAEGAANGTKIVDSSGFNISQFVEWQHAKASPAYTTLPRYIPHTPHGKVCAATVTPGQANNSPYLK